MGSPCVDEGEELPLHGSIANTPAEQAYWYEENGELLIRAIVKDETNEDIRNESVRFEQ